MQHIIIADSHAVCRSALQAFIQHADQDIRVEGVEDYASLLEKLSNRAADLILLDQSLPGLPASPEDMDFKTECPGTKIGVMTDAFAIDAKDTESVNIFPKSLGSKQFLDGIKKVLSGQAFHAEGNMAYTYMLNTENAPQRTFESLKLTQRERQVLSYLITGAVNKDIARALDLQVVTVKLHVRGICRKLEVKNRTQAALAAREYGWA